MDVWLILRKKQCKGGAMNLSAMVVDGWEEKKPIISNWIFSKCSCVVEILDIFHTTFFFFFTKTASTSPATTPWLQSYSGSDARDHIGTGALRSLEFPLLYPPRAKANKEHRKLYAMSFGSLTFFQTLLFFNEFQNWLKNESPKTLWVHFFSEDIGKFIEDGGFQAWSMSQLSRVFFSVPLFETSRGLITPKMKRMMMLPRTPLKGKSENGENPFMKTQTGCKNCKILRSNHSETIPNCFLHVFHLCDII